MLRDLRTVKFPVLGSLGKVGGGGVFPGGSFTADSGFSIGHWLRGMVGTEIEMDVKMVNDIFRPGLLQALGGSAGTVGSTLINFGACRVQIVQSVNAGTAGNLAFLSDRTQYKVSSTYASGQAVGVYLYTCAADDYVFLLTFGDTEARNKAALTNASTIGMPVYQVSDTGGKLDGQAAATAITGTILTEQIGVALATLTNGALTRIHLNPRIRMV